MPTDLLRNSVPTNRKDFINSGEIVLDINNEIVKIIREAKLIRDNNDFFIQASLQQEVSLNAAYNIAYNWREITKAFLFSSIKGIGTLAEKLGQLDNPPAQLMSALQTAYGVIGDDLNNIYPVFHKVAPKGPEGTHYQWWENSILLPLQNIIKTPAMPSVGTKMLIQKMQEISHDPLGIAVQLRIVETIALDICIAFLAIFSKVKHQGKEIFNEADKLWITTHIQAETIHHQQVSSSLSGMAQVATTAKEQHDMLALSQSYAQTWSLALTDFAKFLKIT